MSVIVPELRRFIADMELPQKYSNEDIQDALTDAERYLSENYTLKVTTATGKRILKLQAAIFLLESPRRNLEDAGEIKKLKDGNGTIEFYDRDETNLEMYRRILADELLLQEDPMEVNYDGF